jgi:hypothetical protein
MADAGTLPSFPAGFPNVGLGTEPTCVRDQPRQCLGTGSAALRFGPTLRPEQQAEREYAGFQDALA